MVEYIVASCEVKRRMIINSEFTVIYAEN